MFTQLQLFAGATYYIEGRILLSHKNGDNHIQNFHLGRYIVGYAVGNYILQLPLCVSIKLNFRPYMYISNNVPSQMKILNMVIPILMQ